MSGGLINLRVPVRLGDGTPVTFHLKVSEEDARMITNSPRRYIRTVDTGLVQLIKEGLTKFFQEEEADEQADAR